MFPQCDGPSFNIDWEWVRRWRQPLLALAVLVGGCLTVGWMIREAKYQRQREAVAEIRKLGGITSWDEVHDKSLAGVSFRRRPVGNEVLALVAVLDESYSVDVADTRVGDDGLRHLRGLHRLQLLNAERSQVGDEGLAHLADLRCLMSLHLSKTRVTDAGLHHLENLNQLEWLSLSHTKITDAGVIHLTRLTSLKHIHIYGTAITEKGVAQLLAANPALVINPTDEEYDDRGCCP